jgi:hypothetical protein
MVPRGDSHIYIGATNYLSIKPWSNPNLSDMHFLIDCAVEQLNQNFVWSQLVSWHTGNRPVTIDSCPIVGATSLEGLWIVSGSFRDGLHMSPLLAQQICREIIYEQHVTPHMRGGRVFSDGGVSGFLPVHYSNRRAEIHEETKTKPFSRIQSASGPGGDPG